MTRKTLKHPAYSVVPITPLSHVLRYWGLRQKLASLLRVPLPDTTHLLNRNTSICCNTFIQTSMFYWTVISRLDSCSDLCHRYILHQSCPFMRHFFNQVQGAIDHYPLAIFWPLTRDFLGIVESEYKYQDLGLWDASCQGLGLPTIRQTLAYLDALPSGNNDKPPEARLYAIFMLYRQSESMREHLSDSRPNDRAGRVTKRMCRWCG
jgi:hypothetical protein